MARANFLFFFFSFASSPPRTVGYWSVTGEILQTLQAQSTLSYFFATKRSCKDSGSSQLQMLKHTAVPCKKGRGSKIAWELGGISDVGLCHKEDEEGRKGSTGVCRFEGCGSTAGVDVSLHHTPWGGHSSVSLMLAGTDLSEKAATKINESPCMALCQWHWICFQAKSG